MRIRQISLIVASVVVALLALASVFSVFTVWAGDPDSPGGPTSDAAKMYTLDDIYNRINDGTTAISDTFQEPVTGPPTGTMHTLNEIYDLVGERAPVPKTGQTQCYKDDGTTGTCTCGTANCPSRQDGDLERGVSWPTPRFTDNGNGTVTDNLTGLMWLKDGDCLGPRTWSAAFTYVSNLNAGTNYSCDGFTAGTYSDWRLPNLRELYSLIHLGQANSAMWLNTQGFSGVQSSIYWSSTTYASSTEFAWYVFLNLGYVSYDDKANYGFYVWPVRGGQ
jgi:hypothetical protein